MRRNVSKILEDFRENIVNKTWVNKQLIGMLVYWQIVNKEPMVYSSEYPFSVKSTKISFDAGIASLELPWLQNQNKWFFCWFLHLGMYGSLSN